nr:MAG TPA: tail collar fiber protein [Caudoviricetes sp.]
MKILDKTTQTYKELVLKPGGDTLPIGGIIAFASDTIPSGWLLCDGRAVSRTEYAELFKVIGTKHGSGNGSTTFNLPNPKGRTLVGKDSTDTDFNELGKTGGEKTHTLTVSEMPSHNHLRDIENKIVNNGSGGAWSPSLKGTGNMTDENNSTRNTGGGQAHNNLQPYLAENFIIKAKNTVVVKGDVIQENGTASENNTYSAKAIDNKLKTNIVTGQEIATNEYIDGKRVYKRNISAIGENSSGTTLTLSNINFDFSEIWIDESNSFISSESETLSINWYFAPEDYCRLWIGKNTKIIRYRTGGNLSGRTFNVMLKYTKNA